MFAYLKGILESKNNEQAVIDVNGVGYRLAIPYSTYANLPDIGETVKLSTYLAVREDNISLYGFYSPEEVRVFELLISVSGIGPKLALGVLSNITPGEFSLAVITDDFNKLTNISGIGKKTAQRVVIELKDKLKKEEITTNVGEAPVIRTVINNDIEEAISALMVLGYSNKDAVSMVNAVAEDNINVQEIIKRALKKV